MKMRHFVNYMRKKNISGPFFQHLGMKNGSCTKIKTVGDFIVRSDIDPLQLYKLNFHGTNYATLATPLTSSGDFEIQIKFNTTDTTSWKMLLGVLGSSVNFLGIAATTGQVRFDIEAQRLNSVVRVDDGLDHKVKVRRIGNSYSLIVDDVVQETMTYTSVGEFTVSAVGTYDGVTFSYIGVIYYFNLKDLSNPGNSTSWTIDCNCTDRQPSNEFSADTSKDLILNNVVTNDWDEIV